MARIKQITLCSSASLFKKSLEIKESLEKLGFKVRLQHTAKIMKRTGDYKVSSYKLWYKDPKFFKRKAFLIQKHFDEVAKTDAILVINMAKNRERGYIGGGSVLMEMGLAFYSKKPIFVLNKISKRSSVYEEVMGMMPIFIEGDLKEIK